MEKTATLVTKKKLTLDKIVASLEFDAQGGKRHVRAVCTACKSSGCQHCQIPIAPTRR